MKILIDLKDKCFGIMIGRVAYTIARHGRPFGNLWENGWSVLVLYKSKRPFFGILKYKLN